MPVFEMAKNYEDKDATDDWRFSDWFKSLNIKIVPGTTILNIKYSSTNKESIIPILKKINSTYQIYSSEKK